jgi:hypothetical protein
MGGAQPDECAPLRPMVMQNRRIVNVSRRRFRHWALWLFAAALLLKSAMPFLASVSAQMQGKALVEVCTVYGVSLVPAAGDNPAPTPATDQAGDHARDHCALSALTALATPAPASLTPMAVAPRPATSPPARQLDRAPDATAAWAARLEHGPPAIS